MSSIVERYHEHRDTHSPPRVVTGGSDGIRVRLISVHKDDAHGPSFLGMSRLHKKRPVIALEEYCFVSHFFCIRQASRPGPKRSIELGVDTRSRRPISKFPMVNW